MLRTGVGLYRLYVGGFGAAIPRGRYGAIPTIYTQASPNPNGLNPNVTVGMSSVGIAAPGDSGPFGVIVFEPKC